MLGYKVGHYFYDATAVFKNAEGLISCTFDDDNKKYDANRILQNIWFKSNF